MNRDNKKKNDYADTSKSAKSVNPRKSAIQTIKKYPKYKPSGVEWIGDIPEEWDENKLKYLIRKPISDGPHESPEFLNEGIPFLSVDSIQNGELIFEGCRFISEEEHNRYKKKTTVEKNDLLIGKAASIGKIARVKVDFEFNIWSPLAIIKPNNKINHTYFEYFLKSTLSQYQIEILCTSNTQKNISMADIPKILVILPPKPEQTAIANYLDDKTAKIDSLIEKKKKLIELYKEERTAVINQAVTRGIDPDVKLRDSGIDWLGPIPEHWEMKKLKYVAKLRDELIDDSDFKIAVENIESGTGKLVGMEDDKNYLGKLSAFRNGDTIFNKLRPYLHKVYYAEQNGGIYGELLIIYSLGELDSKFLFYKVFSKIFIDVVDGSTQGTKMPRANWNDFISLLDISFPKDKAEQLKIVQHIETETKRIDGKIARTEKEIELLQEYRTALISEVVTGKIKVC